jgi:hypothetical protein
LRRAGQKVRAGFDRLRGKRPKSHADHERAKHEREQAAFATTKARLDRLFTKGVSRGRLAAEVALLKLRYRWSTLRVQGPAEGRHVSVLGGFSPVRPVTEGELILAAEADDLRTLLKRDAVALAKLDQVEADPHIADSLKHRFIKNVQARMKHWAKQASRPPLAGYEVMCNVVRHNRREWTLLGPVISTQEIRDAQGLTRLVDAGRVYRTMLKRKYQNQYPTVNAWVRAISADNSLLRLHIRPSAKLSGKNQVAFWSERYQANGIKIEKYVKRFQLQASDYPLGAVRFALPPAQADIAKFHKPTAFDGMPHRGWTAPNPLSIWGAIRAAEAADVREAVSEPVEVAATTDFRWIAGM